MFIAGVGTGGVLPDPVSMMAMETRSEMGGMAYTSVSGRSSFVWIGAISATTSTTIQEQQQE